MKLALAFVIVALGFLPALGARTVSARRVGIWLGAFTGGAFVLGMGLIVAAPGTREVLYAPLKSVFATELVAGVVGLALLSTRHSSLDDRLRFALATVAGPGAGAALFARMPLALGG